MSGSKNVEATDITCGPGHGIRSPSQLLIDFLYLIINQVQPMQSDFQGVQESSYMIFLPKSKACSVGYFAVLVAWEQIIQGPKFQTCLLIEQHFQEPPTESESRLGR